MGGSLLDALTGEQRATVEARSVRRSVATGEVVFRQGDAGEYLALVISGRLAVEVGTVDGHTAIVRVVGQDDVVGEFCLLLPDAARSATLVAIEPSELRIIHRAAFTDARHQYPELDGALVVDLAARLSYLSGELVSARYGTIGQRVANQLLALDEIYRRDWIPLTQEVLANLTGGTRQTVNRALRKAADAELIELRRGAVRLLDREGLADYAG